MLQSDHFSEGCTNKIHIKDKDVKDVVEFFQLLYPNLQKKFSKIFFVRLYIFLLFDRVFNVL